MGLPRGSSRVRVPSHSSGDPMTPRVGLGGDRSSSLGGTPGAQAEWTEGRRGRPLFGYGQGRLPTGVQGREVVPHGPVPLTTPTGQGLLVRSPADLESDPSVRGRERGRWTEGCGTGVGHNGTQNDFLLLKLSDHDVMRGSRTPTGSRQSWYFGPVSGPRSGRREGWAVGGRRGDPRPRVGVVGVDNYL